MCVCTALRREHCHFQARIKFSPAEHLTRTVCVEDIRFLESLEDFNLYLFILIFGLRLRRLYFILFFLCINQQFWQNAFKENLLYVLSTLGNCAKCSRAKCSLPFSWKTFDSVGMDGYIKPAEEAEGCFAVNRTIKVCWWILVILSSLFTSGTHK